MPIKLDPVDYDPFEVVPEQLQYEPVDHDPFAPQKNNPRRLFKKSCPWP